MLKWNSVVDKSIITVRDFISRYKINKDIEYFNSTINSFTLIKHTTQQQQNAISFSRAHGTYQKRSYSG